MSTEAACLVRLQRVEPLIASLPNVLYDFTFPQLSERTMMLLQGNKMQHDQPYRGYRFAHRSTEPHDDRPLRAFEAAQFISVVYGSLLAPLRCGAAESGRNVKKHFIDSFVRTLCHPKVLNALETVAHDIEAMRGLDEFQSGAGSTAVHWLNYLATEALNGSSILLWGALPWNHAAGCDEPSAPSGTRPVPAIGFWRSPVAPYRIRGMECIAGEGGRVGGKDTAGPPGLR